MDETPISLDILTPFPFHKAQPEQKTPFIIYANGHPGPLTPFSVAMQRNPANQKVDNKKLRFFWG
jgi:hypothetical protein